MKRILLIVCFAVTCSSLIAQSKVMDKINALNKQLESDFNSNNMDKVAGLYLDSAFIMGGGANVTGRAAIDNYWMSLKDKQAKWKLEIDKIEDYGNIVIQRGRSYLTFSPERQSNVRFVLIWKKDGDSYKVLYDTYARLQ